jgi:hypothetical protein
VNTDRRLSFSTCKERSRCFRTHLHGGAQCPHNVRHSGPALGVCVHAAGSHTDGRLKSGQRNVRLKNENTNWGSDRRMQDCGTAAAHSTRGTFEFNREWDWPRPGRSDAHLSVCACFAATCGMGVRVPHGLLSCAFLDTRQPREHRYTGTASNDLALADVTTQLLVHLV